MNIGWNEKEGIGGRKKKVLRGKKTEEEEEDRAINYSEKNSLKTALFYWMTPPPFF